MVQKGCVFTVLSLLAASCVVWCSDSGTVLVVPGILCSSTGLTVPVCNALTALRFCSVTTEKGDDVADLITDMSDHFVVLSNQVVHELSEHAFLSSTVIARAIVDLTQQFSWSPITIVADIADKYFLQTAEVFYRIANLSSDSNFLQLTDSDSEIEDLVNKVDRLNLRIVVLSLRPHLVSKLLCRASERHLVWPEYAWIIHSVEVSQESCGDNSTLDGVITLHDHQAASYNYSNEHLTSLENGFVGFAGDYMVHNLSHCSLVESAYVSISLQSGSSTILTAHYNGSLEGLSVRGPIPSALPPQYNPSSFIALYYLGIAFCFMVVTVTLVLYFYFRNEPEIKATSISLSVLIFIACYMLIYYLLVLNSTLLPSYHKRSTAFRNFICSFRVWIHGLGFPTALILSTLLVKLLRVYRIFNCHGKISKYTSGNLALAVYALLLTSPNAIICLVWATSDHYLSTVSSSIQGGHLVVRERCVSSYTIQWLLGLQIHLVILSVLLVVVAIMTRKVSHENFKDTKKVSALCFVLVLTLSMLLAYWYVLRLIRAHVVAVHGVLHIGHYCIILECQGFIFAPKLFPIVKERLMRRYYRASSTPITKAVAPSLPITKVLAPFTKASALNTPITETVASSSCITEIVAPSSPIMNAVAMTTPTVAPSSPTMDTSNTPITKTVASSSLIVETVSLSSPIVETVTSSFPITESVAPIKKTVAFSTPCSFEFSHQ